MILEIITFSHLILTEKFAKAAKILNLKKVSKKTRVISKKTRVKHF